MEFVGIRVPPRVPDNGTERGAVCPGPAGSHTPGGAGDPVGEGSFRQGARDCHPRRRAREKNGK